MAEAAGPVVIRSHYRVCMDMCAPRDPAQLARLRQESQKQQEMLVEVRSVGAISAEIAL